MFDEEQLGALLLEEVIDLVKGPPDQMDSQTSGLNQIEGTTLQLIWLRLAAEVPEAKADAAISIIAPAVAAKRTAKCLFCFTIASKGLSYCCPR